jgi:hypothetical protein
MADAGTFADIVRSRAGDERPALLFKGLLFEGQR